MAVSALIFEPPGGKEGKKEPIVFVYIKVLLGAKWDSEHKA